MPRVDTNLICIKSFSESETIELGRKLGTLLEPGDHIYLYGEIGTGKTRIAKGLIGAATNTPQDEIISPTFTLLNRYDGDMVVYHADLYRIETGVLEDTGIEMAQESDGVLIVEWAEKFLDPTDDALRIGLSHTDQENVRTIVIEWGIKSTWCARLSGQCLLAKQTETVVCEPYEQIHSGDGGSLCRS